MDLLKQIRQVANQVGELITDEVRAHIELGAALLEQCEFEGAIHELLQALKVRPDHARALYLLGLCYFRRGKEGDTAQAQEQLLLSIQKNSDFAEPYIPLAEIYYRQGRIPEALGLLQKGLVLASSLKLRKEFQRWLGRIYAEQQMDHKALRELRKSFGDASVDPETLKLLTMVVLRDKTHFSQHDPWFLRELKQKLFQETQKNSSDVIFWYLLGCLLWKTGENEESERAFLSGLELKSDDIEILRAYSELLLQQSKAQAAMPFLQQVVALPKSSPVHWGLLGRCYQQLGRPKDAVAAYTQAVASLSVERTHLPTQEIALLTEALQCALGAEEEEVAQRWALHPAMDSIATAIAVRARATHLTFKQAQALLQHASLLKGSEDCSEIPISSAFLLKKEGHEPEAVAELQKAVVRCPTDPRPFRWLQSWYDEKYHDLPDRLSDLLQRALLFFAETSEYLDAIPLLNQIRIRLHAPFALAILGEFNAGKSTLLNALLGEELVPMGITPTTGVITLFTYAEERSIRIIYQTGEEVAIPWEERVHVLRGLDEEEALKVKWVQISCPSPVLKETNLIDTPGFNSLLLEHETITRDFIEKADGLVWVFASEQAGKATERAILASLRDLGVGPILGVLNKVDRLARKLDPNRSLSDLESLTIHLSESGQGVSDLLLDLIPVSGKQALAARNVADSSLLTASHMPALELALHHYFFSQKDSIKEKIAIRQFLSLLDKLEIRSKLAQNPELEKSWELGKDSRSLLLQREDILAKERKQLIVEISQLHATMATEILEFARPRSWLFGDNHATLADQNFLKNLVEELLQLFTKNSQVRIEQTLAFSTKDETNAIVSEVYHPYLVFAKGYLEGGFFDRFFLQVLPKMELTEFAIVRMLDREFPTALDIIDRMLLLPLKTFIDHQFLVEQNLREGKQTLASFEQFAQELYCHRPLQAFRQKCFKRV